MRTFEPQPRVRLVRAFPDAFASVVTSARTCYSSRGIVETADLDDRDRRLAQSLYEAGHHTTFQHAYFQFAVENVSRLLVWSFLHSHPYYNSEQVSQRYVAVREENFLVPPLEEPLRHRYVNVIRRLMAAYRELVERLYPLAEAAYFQRFPGRRHHQERYVRAIRKKAQEVARYVLPLATLTYLYHTVSALTVLRYWKTCRAGDVPLEQQLVAEQMVRSVLDHAPQYRWVLEEPVLEEDLEPWRVSLIEWPVPEDRKRFVAAFDRDLDGRISKLVQAPEQAPHLLAEAVRSVLGVTAERLSDDEAVALALDPARNPALGGSLNVGMHLRVPRALQQVHYTFKKKLSHAADAQDQRHRAVPGARPTLWASWTGEPDYVVPVLVQQDPAVERYYRNVMDRLFEEIRQFLAAGAPPPYAAYLLPNAFPVRFLESGDLLALRHKFAMRLCYNAQEEIWRATLEEWQQIRERHPTIGQFLGPPCTLRWMAGIRPYCPEGDRFCGERVWVLEPSAYQRVI